MIRVAKDEMRVRKYYNVPADIGRRVTVNGRAGVIAEDMGHYIGVNFDDDEPKRILPCHPTWKVEYGELGTVRPMTRSQQRYRRYLKCGECFDSFIDFCRWDSDRDRTINQQQGD